MPCSFTVYVRRQDSNRLQQLADSAAAESAADGTPCLLLAASQLAEAAQELAEQEAAALERQAAGTQPARGCQAGGHGQPQQPGGCVLSRRCIVFHHIKNLNKRKAIVQWGGELRLGGWSKPGFPGVVLVEVRAGAGPAQPTNHTSC